MAIPGTSSLLGTGTLTRLTRDTAALREQMQVLTRQSSDGKRATVYGDLAPDTRRAIDLKADAGRREAYSAAATRTLARTQATQGSLDQLTDIAKSFMQEAFAINGTEPARISSVATAARNALAQVASLLNEQQAGEYIFGGSDSANPPIPDPDQIANTAMVSDIVASVQTLTTTNAATIMADTLTAAQSTASGYTPFSDYLEDPALGGAEVPRSIVASDGETIRYGVFANRNTYAISTGETTGAWSRDILRGLAMLSALDPAMVQQGQGFDDLMSGIRTVFASATDALAVESGTLGTAEARITKAKDSHADMITSLQSQLGTIEDADLATTIAALQDVQTRLQASYKAIATVGQLNLVDFLR